MDHHSFVNDLKEGMLLSIFLLFMMHYFYFFTFYFVFKGALCISKFLLPIYNTLQASQEERSRSVLYNQGVHVGFCVLCFKGISF